MRYPVSTWAWCSGYELEHSLNKLKEYRVFSPLNICLIILIGIAFMVKGYTAYNKHVVEVFNKSMQPVVRLHILASGQFFCTGTVVSDKHIITAAHCVMGAPLGVPLIEVRRGNGVKTNVKASVVGYNGRSDQAVLYGNFTDFPAKDIVTDPNEIEKIITDPDSDLIMCGYPYAGPLACSPFKFKYHAGFQFAGTGFLIPGMSGGPVIDRKTGKIVAENLGIEAVPGQVSNTLISPLTNIYYSVGLLNLE